MNNSQGYRVLSLSRRYLACLAPRQCKETTLTLKHRYTMCRCLQIDTEEWFSDISKFIKIYMSLLVLVTYLHFSTAVHHSGLDESQLYPRSQTYIFFDPLLEMFLTFILAPFKSANTYLHSIRTHPFPYSVT